MALGWAALSEVWTVKHQSRAVWLSVKNRKKKEKAWADFYRGVQIPNLHGGWVYRRRITAFNRAQLERKNRFSSGSSAFAQPDPMYFNLPSFRAIQKAKAKETCCPTSRSPQSRGWLDWSGLPVSIAVFWVFKRCRRSISSTKWWPKFMLKYCNIDWLPHV
jgi:hypothetical protein